MEAAADRPDLGRRLLGVRTDGEGGFRIGGLEHEEYMLTAFDEGTLDAVHVGPFAPGAPGSDEIEVRYVPGARRSLAGRVLLADGRPLGDARVRLFLDLGPATDGDDRRLFQVAATRRTAFTDVHGSFALGELADMPVLIEVEHPFASAHCAVAPVSLGGQREPVIVARGAVYLQLIGAPGHSLSVLDADGAELSLRGVLGHGRRHRIVRGRTPLIAVDPAATTLLIHAGDGGDSGPEGTAVRRISLGAAPDAHQDAHPDVEARESRPAPGVRLTRPGSGL